MGGSDNSEALGHIADVFAGADIDDLHLEILLGDADGEKVAHGREVAHLGDGLVIVNAAPLVLLLFVEFLLPAPCSLYPTGSPPPGLSPFPCPSCHL